jgi:hypothetical protein
VKRPNVATPSIQPIRFGLGSDPLDLAVVNHEVWHCVVAFIKGFPINFISADRSHVLEGGVCRYRVSPNDPRSQEQLAVAQAVVSLAPEMAGAFSDERQLRADRERVKFLWASVGNPPGWIEARQVEAFALVNRRDLAKPYDYLTGWLFREVELYGPDVDTWLTAWGPEPEALADVAEPEPEPVPDPKLEPTTDQ